MSLFDDDDEIRSVIAYFNSLSDEIKARIVSNLHPQKFRPKEHFNRLFPLMSKVQKDISKHNDIKITNRLLELGLEETYAMLLVNNMKKQAPTLEYHLNQMNLIDDEKFEHNIEKIINEIWIDSTPASQITEKYDIRNEQYAAISKVTTDMLIGLLRNDTNEKHTFMAFTKNGLSKRKTEALLRGVQPHLDKLYSSSLFSNVQDIFFKMERLEAQNNEIIRNMEAILDLLRKSAIKK